MLDFGINSPLDILKWVGLVLAAGFIGYFGRYLSMLIIDRFRRRKASPSPAEISPGETTAVQATASKSRLKLEKKRAKQAVKGAKKGDKG